MRTKAMREKRAKLIEDARALFNGESVTAEDRAKFDTMMAEADTLKGDIDRIEAADKLEAELRSAAGPVAAGGSGKSVDETQDEAAREKRILRAYLSGNVRALSDQDRQSFAQRLGNITDASGNPIQNAAGTGDANGSGLTIAPLFQRELLVAMKAFGGVRGAARDIATDTGASLPWPTMDDTSNVATIIGENTQVPADTDLSFGSRQIGSYTYRSGVLTISLQLLQDSAFDFDALIRSAMATRFARGQNAHFTNGDGNGKPQGILVGAAAGPTVAKAAITFDNLIDLEHSVDPAYRQGASYMFNDATLKALRQIKDAQGRYLWQAGANTGAPDTLNNRPYSINQDMPVIGASAKSVVFGDFNNYIIRDVLGMQMMVLRERYADYLQVGYISFMRTDGKLVSAGQPIKYLQHAAA